VSLTAHDIHMPGPQFPADLLPIPAVVSDSG
jgi:hypothetical protein